MRRLRNGLVMGVLLIVGTRAGLAQNAGEPVRPQAPGSAPAVIPIAAFSSALGAPTSSEGAVDQEAAVLQGAQADDLKKQVDLLQKLLQKQQEEIELLQKQLKRLPSEKALEKMQTQNATLEGRAAQAARRDRELAGAVDDLREHTDAEERWGPLLPATLKELFLPSETNESPMSIYGHLVGGYRQFDGAPSRFVSPDFAPFFLITLNQQLLLEADMDITTAGISLGTAQLDWIISDWLTLVAGRYITPVGFFNERLNHEWINKLPDVPLMFRQVSPLSFNDGLQARGAAYLGDSPVKLEYSLYVGNGFQFASVPATYSAAVDLEGLIGQPDEVDAKAIGGRLGIWVPECGITAGVSVYYQNEFLAQTPNDIRLWQVDAGYHHGNWDFRFEFAQLFQQASLLIGNDVVRTGLYVQGAYRPFDASCPLVRNTEVVARYSMARFRGIDQTQLDPGSFADSVGVPVDRDQYTFGINYYFEPAVVLKLAYEINKERASFNLRDNVFLAQFVWAF
jgi:hypothetical protein